MPGLGDVDISLTHVATGKSVKLMPNLNDADGFSCGSTNLNTSFDDESITTLTCNNITAAFKRF
jgi:hypothetical protein